MDGQQYLNQISESEKAVKKARGKKNIFSSKFFILGMIALGILLLTVILGAVLGGGKKSEKALSYDLKLHLDNTAEVIKTYQNDIKSSELRSESASLYGVLSNTSKELTDYLVEKYNFKDKSISKEKIEEATLVKDALSNELFEAKINGILDRIFAHKMAYEITIIQTEEARLVDATNNERLQELLGESDESLTILYEKFSNFSEAK